MHDEADIVDKKKKIMTFGALYTVLLFFGDFSLQVSGAQKS